jgi:chromosome segregation ATPase
MSPRIWAALLAVTLAAACKSTGPDLAANTADAMRSLYKSMEAAPTKIDQVTTSLTELAKGGGDMRKQFDSFNQSVDELVSHRDRIRSLRTEVQSNRDVFQQQWKDRLAEIKDADLRQRASERQQAVAAEFAKVSEAGDQTRKEFEPWMETVLDVRSYLENDLNPDGVASVADKVKQVKNGAADINKSITGVLTQVQELAKKIEAAKPPPPPAPEPKAEKK